MFANLIDSHFHRNHHHVNHSSYHQKHQNQSITSTPQPSLPSTSRSVNYYIKLLAVILSLLFIQTVNCDKLGLIDRNDESLLAEIKDLNNKIDSSEKVLTKLLQNKDVQASSELKEHVEKILDYLRFRKDGINTWKINYRQFETMRDGINKDYAALPFKIVHILSQASKNKILHVVPYS